MPTAEQINELEVLARKAHDKNHRRIGWRFEHCKDLKCLDARLSIAWLRARLRTREKEERRGDPRNGTSG